MEMLIPSGSFLDKIHWKKIGVLSRTLCSIQKIWLLCISDLLKFCFNYTNDSPSIELLKSLPHLES